MAGHAAEEVERLITIPLENELNGIADVTFLRSDTLFGLSNIRSSSPTVPTTTGRAQQAQERISQAELPGDAKPGAGAAVQRDRRGLPLHARVEDDAAGRAQGAPGLGAGARVPQVPGVADVVSWGGGTKQYQVMVDPARLRAYNLTLKQVIDAVNANNANAGGSYIRQGQYALTVRGIGLIQIAARHRATSWWPRRRARPCGCGDLGQVEIGHAIRLGSSAATTTTTLVQGIVLMRKGENPGRVIEGGEGASSPEIETHAAGRRGRSARTTAATSWCAAR